jgi:hypothetical protein
MNATTTGVLALIALITCGATVSAAEPLAPASKDGVTQREVPESIQRIERAVEYSLKVTVKGSDEEVSVAIRDLPPAKISPQIKKEKPRQWVADHWYGHRMVPHVLLQACGEPAKGSVQVELSLAGEGDKGKKEIYVMRSAGLAADVYLVSALGMQKQFAQWLAKAVPDSKEVQPLKPDGERPIAEGKDVKLTDELKPVLAAATDKYNEQRPELLKRFGGSFLFYPLRKEKERDWAIVRIGDKLVFETSCADRMFYATFRLEFQQAKDGKWQYVRTLAAEEFKGE